jgi:3-phenylpropionate/cinnamic acid dioxygenase small subunit
MVDAALHAAVSEMLFREARFLDEQKWAQWLELYSPDAVFWVPATRMDGGYTTDPERELNYIYINGRAGLEARIFRLETNSSIASTPPPRTCHLVTGVTIDEENPKEVLAFAKWQVVSFSETRGQQTRSGSYAYVLRREGEGFRIACKKIMLLEHVIDGYFDVYTV